MPNAVVKSYAEKSGKSPDHIEGYWKDAEQEAKKKFPKKGPHYWAYVNGIVKRRAGIHEETTFKELMQVLEATKDEYEKCLVFQNESAAEAIAKMARDRDGAEIRVDGRKMYFPDKFTFDHIVYHYKAKMQGDQKPAIENA